MRQLIINGDPGIRKGAVIEYDGEEVVCFAVTRQGDWHGPDRVQLWCTVGQPEEMEAYETRDYVPMHLETDRAEAEAITVVKAKGDPATQ